MKSTIVVQGLDFSWNFLGPFGAIMTDLGPSRPHRSTRQGFLVDPASHESSVAHLGSIFDNFVLIRNLKFGVWIYRGNVLAASLFFWGAAKESNLRLVTLGWPLGAKSGRLAPRF